VSGRHTVRVIRRVACRSPLRSRPAGPGQWRDRATSLARWFCGAVDVPELTSSPPSPVPRAVPEQTSSVWSPAAVDPSRNSSRVMASRGGLGCGAWRRSPRCGVRPKRYGAAGHDLVAIGPDGHDPLHPRLRGGVGRGPLRSVPATRRARSAGCVALNIGCSTSSRRPLVRLPGCATIQAVASTIPEARSSGQIPSPSAQPGGTQGAA
jgi:hypothetical protein